MSALREFVGDNVKILTSDGRLIIGQLEGYDQNTNIVLTKSKERVFYNDKGSKELEMGGGVIIRGDDVICVGGIDEKVEFSTDYTKIYAEKLKDTKNPLSN